MIPAEAGIYRTARLLDSRLRGNDGLRRGRIGNFVLDSRLRGNDDPRRGCVEDLSGLDACRTELDKHWVVVYTGLVAQSWLD